MGMSHMRLGDLARFVSKETSTRNVGENHHVALDIFDVCKVPGAWGEGPVSCLT